MSDRFTSDNSRAPETDRQSDQDSTVSPATLKAEQVIAFLEQQPDFLSANPEILDLLVVPHKRTGGTASLLEYQLDILREKNRDLSRKLRDLVTIAGENQQLMERVHGLVLAMMACATPRELLGELRGHMHREFHAQAVSVCLFDHASSGDDDVEGLKIVARDAPEIQAFAEFLTDLTPLCGRLKPDKLAFLYGEQAGQIKSSVLLPLDSDGGIGMLGIGSTDDNRFYPGMGTEFLRMIGEVLGRHLAREPAASERLSA